jgi:hypothetical protein
LSFFICQFNDIEARITVLLEQLTLPKEVYDWAMAYLKHVLAKGVIDRDQELRKLKKRIAEV